MGIKLERKKPRNLLLSFIYLLNRMTSFIGARLKLKLYLDLAWIFHRLAHEQTYQTNIKATSNAPDFLLSGLKEEEQVLDLGCGSGHVILRLLSKKCQVVGVDIDTEALNQARERIPDSSASLIESDIGNFLSNNDRHFDAVVLSHVLEHIDNPGVLVNELSEISDRLYIEVPDFECTHLNLYRVSVETDLVYTDNDHVSEFDRQELQELIEANGFEIQDSDHRFAVLKFWCKKK